MTTVKALAPDQSIDVSELFKRIATLEQMLTSPSYSSTVNHFPEIYIGSPGSEVPLRTGVSAPTALVLAWGSFFNDVFVDVSWTAPGDGSASYYRVEWARKQGAVYDPIQVADVAGTAIRLRNLIPNSTYGIRVTAVNRLGQSSAYLPAANFTDIAVGEDTTNPSTVTGLSVSAGFRSVTITFNDVTDIDVKDGQGLYEVQIDTSNTFPAPRSKLVGGSVTAFSDLVTGTTYYVRVRAIDSSGNSGPFSSTASATTAQTQTADYANLSIVTAAIANLAVDNSKIANLAVDTAKIASLAVTDAKINDLNVSKLVTGTMSATIITVAGSGAIIVGNPPTTGLQINSQGISLYSGGVRTVFLDALTGAGSFTGDINGSTITGGTISGSAISGGTITGGTYQTTTGLGAGGPQGTRIGPGFGGIELFTGMASETTPGRIIAVNNGGEPTMRLEGPRLSGGGAPQPYMDFIGGTGSFGKININASSDVVISGGTVYLERSGAYRINLSSNGVELMTTTWLNNQTFYLRTPGDTNHALWYDSSTVNGPVLQGYDGVMLQAVAGGSLRVNASGGYLGQGWYRTYGAAGWYSETYTGGIYMTDTTWVRVYNSKWFLCDGVIRANNVVESVNPFCTPGPSTGYIRMSSGNRASFHWDGSNASTIVDDVVFKTFVIQHPKKKDNYLVHAAIEGPTADVIYRGRGQLENGVCWVQLPEYFENLTKKEGRTVVLTPVISQSSVPTLKQQSRTIKARGGGEGIAVPTNPVGTPSLGATDVVDGWFVAMIIGGYVRDCEFFWEVKAIRNDAPAFDAEPLKTDVKVRGDGPYRYISN